MIKTINAEEKYYIYTPEKETLPKAILQVTNDIEAEFLTSNGVIVCGTEGNDLHALYETMRRKYRSLPYIMMGQGMGSYLVRDYISEHGKNIDGAVLVDVNPKKDHSYKQIIKKIKKGKWLPNVPPSLSIFTDDEALNDTFIEAELNDVTNKSYSETNLLDFINYVYEGVIASKIL
ncbi:MAG: alpha/beta hydrolase [Oscillospiraceae bacterium]|nr:alpha/beta hydrolase [Oscillospiraceae bacterium]